MKKILILGGGFHPEKRMDLETLRFNTVPVPTMHPSMSACPTCLSIDRAKRNYVAPFGGLCGDQWHAGGSSGVITNIQCPTCNSSDKNKVGAGYSFKVCGDAWHTMPPSTLGDVEKLLLNQDHCPTCVSKVRSVKHRVYPAYELCCDPWHNGSSPGVISARSTCPTCESMYKDKREWIKREGTPSVSVRQVCVDPWHDTTPPSTCPTCGSYKREEKCAILGGPSYGKCSDAWHTTPPSTLQVPPNWEPGTTRPMYEYFSTCPNCGSSDPNKSGARHKYSTCSKEIDKAKGSACGYVSKYIAKNIDGFQVGEDFDTDGQAAGVGYDPGCADPWHSVTERASHNAPLVKTPEAERCPRCKSYRANPDKVFKYPNTHPQRLETEMCDDAFHTIAPVQPERCPQCGESWQTMAKYLRSTDIRHCGNNFHVLSESEFLAKSAANAHPVSGARAPKTPCPTCHMFYNRAKIRREDYNSDTEWVTCDDPYHDVAKAWMKTEQLIRGDTATGKPEVPPSAIQESLDQGEVVHTIDIDSKCKPTFVRDLNTTPWPCNYGAPAGDHWLHQYDEIHAYDVLHLLGSAQSVDTFYEHFAQMWLSLKYGGLLFASVPSVYWSSAMIGTNCPLSGGISWLSRKNLELHGFRRELSMLVGDWDVVNARHIDGEFRVVLRSKFWTP